jgi:glycosyltransferase involved in cell wall biosynthesis
MCRRATAVTDHLKRTGVKKPRVSIGLAVYNGENYLEPALESILAQTFTDFEVVVSDNASTDRTAEICRAYVSRDPRIRYSRNQFDIGSNRNFNLVFNLSLGEYFKWAAHDDLIAPEYLQKCVAVLDADPGTVLCHTKTSIIDAEGKPVRQFEGGLKTFSARVETRFHDMLVDYWCYDIFGVIRSSALARTSLMGIYGHGDGVLLAKLALMGRFKEIPEFLFFNRDHPAKSRYSYSSYKAYTIWLDPSKAGKIILPRWRMGIEYAKAIGSSSLTPMKRARCYMQMGFWVRTFWKSLLANFAVAIYDVVVRELRRLQRSVLQGESQGKHLRNPGRINSCSETTKAK